MKGKKLHDSRAGMKNDICWCWAPSSPAGNNRVFQENKFKDQSGRVRRILEGVITDMRRDEARGSISCWHHTHSADSQSHFPWFTNSPGLDSADVVVPVAALSQRKSWEVNPQTERVSRLPPALPGRNKRNIKRLGTTLYRWVCLCKCRVTTSPCRRVEEFLWLFNSFCIIISIFTS